MTHISTARGFCTTKGQAEHLLEYGVGPKDIWFSGRGAETLDRCLATFRGRAGVLIIAHDLRVFGESKRAVAAVMGRLESLHIRVVDLSHPEDDTVAALMQRASIAISGSRFRDRRAAKQMGRNGGLARGHSQSSARGDIAAEWVIRNIVNDPEISWEKAADIFGGKISESTLRRHYLNA